MPYLRKDIDLLEKVQQGVRRNHATAHNGAVVSLRGFLLGVTSRQTIRRH